jgi:hypothetical protein
MEVLYARCCGLDVHKKSVTACVITPEGREIRSFSTTTAALLELSQWLEERGVRHVAMESTGVYWKPIYNLLEAREFDLCLANAQRVKMVPGRKTDVKDSEWLADLHRHGLLPTSFVPDRDQRELRELVRYRRQLGEERAREVNRLQKVLEGANIKLGDVVADIVGKSGRAMLGALADGVTEVEALSEMRGWIASGISPQAMLGWREEQARLDFQNGGAVAMRNWPYAARLLADPAHSAVAGKVRVTTMPADSILSNYAAQLVAGGWTSEGRSTIGDGVGVQRFSFREGQEAWTAALIIITVGDRREVLLHFTKAQ